MEAFIPFNKPFIIGRELSYIAQAVEDGHLAGDGCFAGRCEGWFEQRLGAQKVFLTTSCTSALEACAILAEIEPGDEVILPSYSFVSTANAFVLRGARPVFVDIRPDTLNLDESRIEAAITPRTRAIVPVHYGGVGCELDTILDVARRHNLLVIEDAAQGVDATYKGRHLGTIGHLGAYSFHETKNFISGEGGALVVNDERFRERAGVVLQKGTDRTRFMRGEVDKYTWVDIGSSYLPSELVSAFLWAQLEKADTITRQRSDIFDYYDARLEPLADRGLVRLPVCPPECRHNAHMFYLVVQTAAQDRDRLIAHLAQRNVMAVFHYVPLHTSPMGVKLGYGEGDLPVTEATSARLIRLPCYFELTRADQDRIIRDIFDFFDVPLPTG